MKVSWKEHLGKKYLYCDLSNSTAPESINIADELITMLGTTDELILLLANVENAVISPEFMNKAKTNGKLFQHKIRKSAVVGINGLKKILIKSYIAFTGSKFALFNSEEEALNYLVG